MLYSQLSRAERLQCPSRLLVIVQRVCAYLQYDPQSQQTLRISVLWLAMQSPTQSDLQKAPSKLWGCLESIREACTLIFERTSTWALQAEMCSWICNRCCHFQPGKSGWDVSHTLAPRILYYQRCLPVIFESNWTLNNMLFHALRPPDQAFNSIERQYSTNDTPVIKIWRFFARPHMASSPKYCEFYNTATLEPTLAGYCFDLPLGYNSHTVVLLNFATYIPPCCRLLKPDER